MVPVGCPFSVTVIVSPATLRNTISMCPARTIPIFVESNIAVSFYEGSAVSRSSSVRFFHWAVCWSCNAVRATQDLPVAHTVQRWIWRDSASAVTSKREILLAISANFQKRIIMERTETGTILINKLDDPLIVRWFTCVIHVFDMQTITNYGGFL